METDRIIDAARGADDGARAAWTQIATAPLPEGWTRSLRDSGFIRNDLRFLRGDDWMFSAVLNQAWVLWYARRPAIRAGLISPDATLAEFADARQSNKGEIKLRLHDGDTARRLLEWSLAKG